MADERKVLEAEIRFVRAGFTLGSVPIAVLIVALLAVGDIDARALLRTTKSSDHQDQRRNAGHISSRVPICRPSRMLTFPM